jgi:hypothetical protein
MDIKGKSAILQKVVFELRYRHGFVYLDKCGRTLDALTTQYPEWTVKDDGVSPQNAPLVSLRNQTLLNFSVKSLNLSQEMRPGGQPLTNEDVKVFAEQVDQAATLIIEELGLKEFERMGFRVWYLFPCASLAESFRWLEDLKLVTISPKFSSSFSNQLESTSIAVVFGGETKYRIALNQVESSAQLDVGQEILNVRASKLPNNQKQIFNQQLQVKKRLLANPQFAAMIDVDAFRDEPQLLAAKEFVLNASSGIERKLLELTK